MKVNLKMRNILLLCISVAIMSACGTLKSLREDLKDTVVAYNDSIRWGQYIKAEHFVDDSVRQEFEARAKAAKNVKIADYRIMNTDFEAEKGEQIVEVEFDYYISPVYQVKTLVDEQKWSYIFVEREKAKQWRLMTPLPEFR